MTARTSTAPVSPPPFPPSPHRQVYNSCNQAVKQQIRKAFESRFGRTDFTFRNWLSGRGANDNSFNNWLRDQLAMQQAF